MANTRAKSIGIPRALTFFVSSFDWKIFFELLGSQVEISQPTNRETFAKGFKVSANDQCLPVKVFHGHLIELAAKNVERIFIPQWVSLQEKTYGCPQVIGAPLLARHLAGHRIPPILMVTIDQNEPATTLLRIFRLALSSSRHPVKLWKACRYFARFFAREETLPAPSPVRPAAGKKTIAIIGRDYVLGDPFLNIDLIERIKQYGFETVTSASHPSDLGDSAYFNCRPVHWSSGRQLVACAHRFMNDEQIDGIIFMNYFGCGMDAFIEEIFKNDLSKAKPYLCLSLDEHTGEAGIVTRLEAFTEMIRRRGAARGA